MGAIENGQLTEKGKLMSEFPTEPGITNVILQAFKRDCFDSVIKIVAMISNSNNLFKRVKSD
jgi:HrpA-like RNA helicase